MMSLLFLYLAWGLFPPFDSLILRSLPLFPTESLDRDFLLFKKKKKRKTAKRIISKPGFLFFLDSSFNP
jgi:hypothetical protein